MPKTNDKQKFDVDKDTSTNRLKLATKRKSVKTVDLATVAMSSPTTKQRKTSQGASGKKRKMNQKDHYDDNPKAGVKKKINTRNVSNSKNQFRTDEGSYVELNNTNDNRMVRTRTRSESKNSNDSLEFSELNELSVDEINRLKVYDDILVDVEANQQDGADEDNVSLLDYEDDVEDEEHGSGNVPTRICDDVPNMQDVSDNDDDPEIILGKRVSVSVPEVGIGVAMETTEVGNAKDNSALKKMFNEFMDERLKEVEQEKNMLLKQLKEAQAAAAAATTASQSKSPDDSRRVIQRTPEKGKTMPQQQDKVIKSPSDTTLYAPALNRINNNVDVACDIGNIAKQRKETELMNKITNFVESIRAEQHEVDKPTNQPTYDEPQPGTSTDDDLMVQRNPVNRSPGLDEASKRAERAIIEAEKFKASVIKPAGMNISRSKEDNCEVIAQTRPAEMVDLNVIRGLLEGLGNIRLPESQTPVNQGVTDDDFFHLTSHIDSNLREKIENGQYVDLDKLLPRDRGSLFDSRVTSDGNPMQWIQNSDGTFLMPAKRASRINSFHRWEQAFRAYATIYCGVNQKRSKEIWQYISVINTAAACYTWENVYNYDMTFRQLMEFNPARSWAVTYNQMWNLSMREPLPPRNKPVFHNFGSNNKQQRRSKPDYCWNFNRGLKCKYGAKCRFIERCSYCDNGSHGLNACQKLDAKEREILLKNFGKQGNKTSVNNNAGHFNASPGVEKPTV